MKNVPRSALIALTALTVLLPSCSLRKAAYNSVADMLAPEYTKKPAEGPNPMIALTGEDDPELVADFFPTALKIYEMMHLQNPTHPDLAIMTGQLYVTYANAFVQQPAERLPAERFDEQNAAYFRAKKFYVRGRDFALKGLELRHPGIGAACVGLDESARRDALADCELEDVPGLFWAGSGALGAFSLDPMDSEMTAWVIGALAFLERAAELDPLFNNGGLWEILMAFYAAAPESLGGGRDKALAAYDRALEINGGKSPGTYVAYARAFCIPAQDGAGFDEAIAKALAIDPNSDPDNRLALTLSRRQAEWLAAHKADFILE